MLAVIKTGGKQYTVKEGDVLRVEKLAVEEGSNFTFDQVLLVGKADGSDAKVGSPVLEGASVEAKIVKQGRAKKIDVRKFKAKGRYYKRYGHRQPFTQVEITKISA